jgi:putative FmdB family regulatory protein
MPTYAYRCSECGTDFERVESMRREDREGANCPDCKSSNVERRFTSVSVKTSRKS